MKPRFEPFGDGLVVLRMLEERDLATTLAWRNRDEVRCWFKSSARIDPRAHAEWFERYARKNDDFVFIVEVDGCPVGQVAVYDIDARQGRGEVGRFVVDQSHAGRGHMARACRLLAGFCAASLGLRELVLQVKADNQRAIGLYRTLGFADDGREGPYLGMRLSIGGLGRESPGRRHASTASNSA